MSDSLTTTVERSDAHGIPDASNGQREGCSLDGIVGLCACGCGTKIFKDSRGRIPRYVSNHHHRGRQQSPDWIAKKSSGLKRAWQDPNKMQALRHQSPELVEKRIRKLRGRKRPPEIGRRVSEALTGRKQSPEHRAKTIKNLCSPRAKEYRWTERPPITPEAEIRRRKSISDQRKGTHNYGRAARDRLDHFNALHWIVRDNRGVIHEFDNLQSWARANEHRFLPDDRPESKLALWRRAVGGFNNMQRTDRKASHQWKGWTLVSVLERKEQGAPDLLARDAQPNAKPTNRASET